MFIIFLRPCFFTIWTSMVTIFTSSWVLLAFGCGRCDFELHWYQIGIQFPLKILMFQLLIAWLCNFNITLCVSFSLDYSFVMSNVTTFITLVFLWLLVRFYLFINESQLGFILKKSCLPEMESTSDLETTYSPTKNTIGTT